MGILSSKRLTLFLIVMSLLFAFAMATENYCRSIGWLGCVDVGCGSDQRGMCANLGRRPVNNCVCV